MVPGVRTSSLTCLTPPDRCMHSPAHNLRGAVLPALVAGQALAAPVGDVEGRIGQDQVSLEVRVAVVVEGVAVGNLAVDVRMARFIFASSQVVLFDSLP